MHEPFILEVTHKGKEWLLEAKLIQAGYTIRFSVIVEETEWIFEQDEEKQFRALLPYGAHENIMGKVDKTLLEAVAEKIASLLA